MYTARQGRHTLITRWEKSPITSVQLPFECKCYLLITLHQSVKSLNDLSHSPLGNLYSVREFLIQFLFVPDKLMIMQLQHPIRLNYKYVLTNIDVMNQSMNITHHRSHYSSRRKIKQLPVILRIDGVSRVTCSHTWSQGLVQGAAAHFVTIRTVVHSITTIPGATSFGVKNVSKADNNEDQNEMSSTATCPVVDAPATTKPTTSTYVWPGVKNLTLYETRETKDLIRPCDIYKEEYSDCTSIKARFHQYFIYGEMVDCSQWKKDFKNCSKWTSDQNIEAMYLYVASKIIN
uniref:Synaptic plasticity regulator PANTS n=1 Tax=Timema tahoe TaxID=61484 RepID=A0A7R9FNL1_9NEOP|nr:unnamed protein product [Timema tahoe]